MHYNIDEIVDQINVEQLATMLETKTRESNESHECKKDSLCLACRVYRKMEPISDNINGVDYEMALLAGILKPNILLITGFILALKYIELKELESMEVGVNKSA